MSMALPSRTPGAGASLLVVIPIYNDWDAVALLLVDLDAVLASAGMAADVLLVDDGVGKSIVAVWTKAPAVRE